MEATQRAAIGRAYYAAHHIAREIFVLENPSVKNKTDGMHEQTIQHFKGTAITDPIQGAIRSQIATNLETLLEIRENCDYDKVIKGDLNSLVGMAIRRSTTIISDCEQVKNLRFP